MEDQKQDQPEHQSGRSHIPVEVLRPYSRNPTSGPFFDGTGRPYLGEQIRLHLGTGCRACNETLDGLRAQNESYLKQFDQRLAVEPAWAKASAEDRRKEYEDLLQAMRKAKGVAKTDGVLSIVAARTDHSLRERLRRLLGSNVAKVTSKDAQDLVRAVLQTAFRDARGMPVTLDLGRPADRALAWLFVSSTEGVRFISVEEKTATVQFTATGEMAIRQAAERMAAAVA